MPLSNFFLSECQRSVATRSSYDITLDGPSSDGSNLANALKSRRLKTHSATITVIPVAIIAPLLKRSGGILR